MDGANAVMAHHVPVILFLTGLQEHSSWVCVEDLLAGIQEGFLLWPPLNWFEEGLTSKSNNLSLDIKQPEKDERDGGCNLGQIHQWTQGPTLAKQSFASQTVCPVNYYLITTLAD